MSASARRRAIAAAAALAVAAPAPTAAGASAGAPPPLSADDSRPEIASERGGGSFGRWRVDEFGLPAYSYTLDQEVDPRARQPEIGGSNDNWSQLGNDAIVANAFNHGYTQLWSQARLYQWANRYDAAARHYAGGFGYLRLEDGRTASTLYLDRPRPRPFRRTFGVGYARKTMRFGGIEVEETTTAPFGDDPALAHEITLTNRSSRTRRLSWWEYWDVNPYDETTGLQRGIEGVGYDPQTRTLTARQSLHPLDSDPQTIFLAAAGAPVAGFEADANAFFGDGGRALPAAVREDVATQTTAPPSVEATTGRAMFALRSPVRLRPGRSTRLRYVYGMADQERIGEIVARAAAGRSTLARSSRAWGHWLPSADFGAARRWLARELAWDAYMVRSSSVYEEGCGHHVITQGGYYQYGMGQQIAFRDPLQHMLPIVYAEPELAREVLRYSFQEQPAGLGVIPYGMGPMCIRLDVGTSNDLDFWLLLALTEYVLASRDLEFLDEEVAYRGGLPAGLSTGSGSVWEHVKLAVQHQETLPGRGPMGHYIMGATGDWSDFSTQFLVATESVLVTAQLAYVYPRLAEVAELRGDHEFAADLRALGERNLELVRGEWTGRGWYARAYSHVNQVGRGAIYAEPQPWAMLAGAPSDEQSRTLVANMERFLQGRGAPTELGGPARIGSSQSPARSDPDVAETDVAGGVGDNNAVFVGGTWYALNGPLIWALGKLEGVVPGAVRRAWDELKRNTLTAHAEEYPDHWTGILHVDDACNSFYASDPAQCGIGLLLDLGKTNGQVTHQPAWGLFSALRLAGIEPDGDGYVIAPRLPMRRYELRLPRVGIAVEPEEMRGYLRTEGAGPLRLVLDPPGRGRPRSPKVWIDGKRARVAGAEDGTVVVHAQSGGDGAVDWALRWRPRHR
jgi:hypothetical protein